MQQTNNYRWLLVVQLYLVTALWGAAQVRGESKVLQFVFSALQASAVSLWVVLDARANGRPLVRIVQELHVFFWLFAAPVYLMSNSGISSRLLLGDGACHWNSDCESGWLLRDALRSLRS